MEYLEHLYEKFKSLNFKLVNFDNGNTPESMQCYLLVENLDKTLMTDKGTTALDIGNYIFHRFGFVFEMPPEYGRGSEAKNSLAFYQRKETFNSNKNAHVRKWVLSHEPLSTRAEHVLYEYGSLTIPHVPPYIEKIAVWKKTGELVIIREGKFRTVIFEAAKKEFRYLQAELGPESDFIILGVL